MARSGLLQVLAATAAVTAAAGIAAASATASWPGQNGRILFSAIEDMAPEPPLARAADCANAHFTFLTSVAADGADPRLVAPGGILPAVSPAGALAYFDVGTDCNGYMSTPDIPLRVREPGGGERTVLTLRDFRFVDPDTTRLAWDRLGRALTYSRRGRIMSIDPQSGSSQLLTKGAGATWSSGDELAFTRRRARGPASRLLAMSGGSVRTLTTVDATAPDWSPDGEWVVFARRSFRRGVTRRSALYVIRRDGSGLRRVTAASVRHALAPVWSPDGQWIAFIRARSSGNTLFVVRADGTQAHAVVRGVVQPAQPAWEALPEATTASRTARADSYRFNKLRGIVAAPDGTATAVWLRARYVDLDHGFTVFSSWRGPGSPQARGFAPPRRAVESTWALAPDATLTEAWARASGQLWARRLAPAGQIGPTIDLGLRRGVSDLSATAAPDGSTTVVWNENELAYTSGDLSPPTVRYRLVGQHIDAQGHALARFVLTGPHEDPLELQSLATSAQGTVAALVRMIASGASEVVASLVLAREGGAPAIVASVPPGLVAMDMAPDGGAYVAWEAEAGGLPALFARSVSAGGVLGPVIRVSPLMDAVDVLARSGDSALVAWSRTWRTRRRVVVRAIGPGGVAGPAAQVGRGQLEVLAPAGDGAVVVWTDDELRRRGTTVSQDSVLHARRVAMDGAPGPGVVVRRATTIESPAVAAAADGSLLVAWTRSGPNGGIIEARRVDLRASTVGPLTRIAWPLKVTVGGLPSSCLRGRATVSVETTVAPTDRLTGIRATIDGRTVARGRRATLRFTARPRALSAGRHRLRVVATTAQGERRSVRRTFRACR